MPGSDIFIEDKPANVVKAPQAATIAQLNALAVSLQEQITHVTEGGGNLSSEIAEGLQDISDRLAAVLATRDESPPLSPLSAGGVDLSANVAATVLAAQPGRVKATVQHIGTSCVVWVRAGAPAAVGVGERLDPGGKWSEWTTAAVSVLATTAGRVATVEWAAG